MSFCKQVIEVVDCINLTEQLPVTSVRFKVLSSKYAENNSLARERACLAKLAVTITSNNCRSPTMTGNEKVENRITKCFLPLIPVVFLPCVYHFN